MKTHFAIFNYSFYIQNPTKLVSDVANAICYSSYSLYMSMSLKYTKMHFPKNSLNTSVISLKNVFGAFANLNDITFQSNDPCFSFKSCLPLITLANPYLMISTLKVKYREYFYSSKVIQLVIACGE